MTGCVTIVRRISCAQAWCPALMTLADLVFLEPKLLLVEDPSAVGPLTWHAIRRVAGSVCQQMTQGLPYPMPWGGSTMIKFQEGTRLCDAVPVCHSLLSLACIQVALHRDCWCMVVP